MPVNKLINRNDRYYIAMYSAHASILENLIGNRGSIQKLLVDAGGLKVPRGPYKSKAIFDGYAPVTDKTLHAKIIYLDKSKILSLWTGNLRKQTLNEQANIVITKKISDRHGNEIKRWFTSLPQKDHLIVTISQNKIYKVGVSKTIWSSFKANLEKITDSNLSLYAFSPWGSSKFVQKAVSHLGAKLIKLSLYTREAPEDDSLWIDTKVNIRNSDLMIQRYIRKNACSFPHYKCVFITRKDGKKERLIWAYVGSANLTEAAFFERSNIEFAVFFDKIRSGSEINRIFNELKRSKNWETRIHVNNKIKPQDEREQEFDEEGDVQDNFEIRKISRGLCKKLKTIKWQRKLEDGYSGYRTEQQIKLNKFSIKVMAVLDGIFDLQVNHKEKHLNFPLSIKRINKKKIYSYKDTKKLVDELLEKPVITLDRNGKLPEDSNKKGTAISPSRNIRFPMASFILDKDFLTKKKEKMRELRGAYKLLTDEDKKIVDMWSQILKEL